MKIFKILKAFLIIAFLILALGIAGRLDYETAQEDYNFQMKTYNYYYGNN